MPNTRAPEERNVYSKSKSESRFGNCSYHPLCVGGNSNSRLLRRLLTLDLSTSNLPYYNFGIFFSVFSASQAVDFISFSGLPVFIY